MNSLLLPTEDAPASCGTLEAFELRLTAAERFRALSLMSSPGTYADAPANSPKTDTEPAPARRGDRIIVADDEPRIRLAIRVCLEAEGYDVEEAPDGRAAIAAIAHAPPDLLLLDLAMPNLDGISTLRLLSTVYADIAPPVIVLTAYGSILAAEASERYGARAFLEKPVIPETLRAVVERIIGEDRRRGRRNGQMRSSDGL